MLLVSSLDSGPEFPATCEVLSKQVAGNSGPESKEETHDIGFFLYVYTHIHVCVCVRERERDSDFFADINLTDSHISSMKWATEQFIPVFKR